VAPHMDVMAFLREKAAQRRPRVVLPEADDETVLAAARVASDEGVATPVLVGIAERVEETAHRAGVRVEDLELVDLGDEAVRAGLLAECAARFPAMSPTRAERRLRSPLAVGSLLVAAGRAEAMVAGRSHTTQEVIFASRLFLELREGATLLSSMFLMRVPGFAGPQGEYIVFADCGVVVAPDAAALAEIAVATARTVRELLGWEPRVALLSFSTKASGYDASVARVREALVLVREREPSLAVDGELQLDAAIVPTVAARKAPGDDRVAGRANVLIFPDLNAGNIAYKCVQRFAKADAYGPFLQGLAGTVSDLSRGSSLSDVVGTITMVAAACTGDAA
jgi:phosphate acetyltransferase